MATTKKRTAVTSRKKAMIVDEGAKGGFTIIEVVLVLAIAGLIFLMVFLALPALQRSQQDSQRRNDMARLNDAIMRFQQNNNGRLPASGSSIEAKAANADGNVPIAGNYDCTGATATNAACRLIRDYINGSGAVNSEWVDPAGFGYGLSINTFANLDSVVNNLTPDKFDEHMAYVVTGAACDGETVVSSGNARDFVIVYRTDGSGTYCH